MIVDSNFLSSYSSENISLGLNLLYEAYIKK